MIEDPPLLTVRGRWPRPTPAQVAALTGVPTGFVVDAMGGGGALDPAVKPIEASRSAFCGVAVTCQAGPSDNLAVFAALDLAQPGDVIVAATDAFRLAAVTGDLVLGMARNKGVVAFVTDGSVRDLPGIRAVGLPCFATGVTPNSPARNGPGTAGLPVVLAGAVVSPGDILVGDEDGVVVVPLARVDDVIARLSAVRAAEADLDAKVKAGLQVPAFVRGLLDGPRIRRVD